jgi:hypothetical protein
MRFGNLVARQKIMTNLKSMGLVAALGIMLIGAGCSSSPTSVASADTGWHAKPWVDAALSNNLAPRGDVMTTNEPKGFYP